MKSYTLTLQAAASSETAVHTYRFQDMYPYYCWRSSPESDDITVVWRILYRVFILSRNLKFTVPARSIHLVRTKELKKSMMEELFDPRNQASRSPSFFQCVITWVQHGVLTIKYASCFWVVVQWSFDIKVYVLYQGMPFVNRYGESSCQVMNALDVWVVGHPYAPPVLPPWKELPVPIE